MAGKTEKSYCFEETSEYRKRDDAEERLPLLGSVLLLTCHGASVGVWGEAQRQKGNRRSRNSLSRGQHHDLEHGPVSKCNLFFEFFVFFRRPFGQGRATPYWAMDGPWTGHGRAMDRLWTGP